MMMTWQMSTRFAGTHLHVQPPSGAGLRRCRAQRCACVSAEAPIERLVSDLVSWCVERGAQGTGLSVFSGTRGRGLVATRHIASGEVLLSVPLDACAFADDDAPRPDLSTAALADLVSVPWWARLACRLLYERSLGSGGEYSPAVQLIPTHLPTTPLVDDSLVDLLLECYPPAGRQCAALRNAVAAAYAYLCTSSESEALLSKASYEEFLHAVAVVHSRCYGHFDETTRRWVRVMVPLCDMANHGGDRVLPPREGGPMMEVVDDGNLRWDIHGGCLLMSAIRDVAPGEEALFSYREQSNDHFLLFYGFVPPSNPHDDLTLFDDVDHLLSWWTQTYGPGTGDDLVSSVRQAVAAVEADVAADSPRDLLDAGANSKQLKVLPGLREDNRLDAAFSVCFAGDREAASRAVAQRRMELREGLERALAAPGVNGVVREYLQDKVRLANEPWAQTP